MKGIPRNHTHTPTIIKLFITHTLSRQICLRILNCIYKTPLKWTVTNSLNECRRNRVITVFDTIFLVAFLSRVYCNDREKSKNDRNIVDQKNVPYQKMRTLLYSEYIPPGEKVVHCCKEQK